ncbi:MAG: GNAT family N-acetyltransferase [Pseudomonadota bacterium]
MTAPATPILETERLILRVPDLSDETAVTGFLGSDRARWHGGPFDAGRAWRVFAAFAGQWPLRGYGHFAVIHRDSGQTAGLVGFWHPGDWPEAELAWSIFDGFEGRGMAHEAALAVRRWGATQPGLARPVSYIDPENVRSRRLAQRLGATIEPGNAGPHPDEPCLVFRHPAIEVLAA